jgi:hypothetical protein
MRKTFTKVLFWNLSSGKETHEGEGEPAGLCVKEKNWLYYMALRWPNRNGRSNYAILLLALKSYCNRKMYTDNKWTSKDKEGVHQFFYRLVRATIIFWVSHLH